MTDKIKWEYQIKTLGSTFKQVKDDDLEALLNEWGMEGWEIIAAHNLESSGKVRLIAKRAQGGIVSRSRSWP
jgi:hypothetical protein